VNAQRAIVVFDARRRPGHTRAAAAAAVMAVMLLSLSVATGCGGGPPQLMPTPNVYATGERDPFPDVPPELRNNRAEVLYLTDRAPEPGSTPENAAYGFKRSRSVAFGVAEVEFGRDVSWADLAKASRTAKRDVKLPMTLTRTTEILRFPPTPNALFRRYRYLFGHSRAIVPRSDSCTPTLDCGAAHAVSLAELQVAFN